MICVSCGKTIDDDSRFCAECGARQPELNVPDALAEEDAPALSEAADPVPEAEEKPAPKEPGPAAPYDPATAYGASEKENAGSIMAASAPDYSSSQQPYGTQGDIVRQMTTASLRLITMLSTAAFLIPRSPNRYPSLNPCLRKRLRQKWAPGRSSLQASCQYLPWQSLHFSALHCA